MSKKIHKGVKDQFGISGNAWVGVLLLLVLIAGLAVALISDATVSITQGKRAQQTVVAQALGDAGIDKAIWKLNKTPGYIGENNIVLPSGTIDIAISNIDANNKQVIATSYVPSKANPKVTRRIRAILNATPSTDDIAFSYAVQVGSDGIQMQNKAKINGSVYANGTISGDGTITGNASSTGSITGITVGGTKKQNQPAIPMPSIDEAYWQNEANKNNDPATSCIPVGGHIGPKRINGNCSLTSGVIIDGPLYITGTLTIGGNISLNSNFNGMGTVIFADGDINTSNSTTVVTSTNPGPPIEKGYILFYTKASVDMATYTTGGVYYAPNGQISIQNHDNPVSIAAKKLDMKPNAELTYEAGLATAEFGAGPGGSWVLKEWQIAH